MTTLTRRQSQVRDLVCEGYTNKQVAAKLGISAKTAESHRYSVMQATGAHSLAELVRMSCTQSDEALKAAYALGFAAGQADAAADCWKAPK